jgi:trans-2,3-dihydro-3-hydroxyanthranilate isomerase
VPSFPYVTVDVFTKERFGGNQLAVFPDASKLPPHLMQRIAREFNFSETTFVFPPNDPSHTRKVRIFTPESELAFAGHPTVGTAFALATLGEIRLTGDETRIVLEENVGPVPVLIRSTGGKAGFAQLSAAKLPEEGPTPPPATELAKTIGLDASDIRADSFFSQGWSCGTAFLFVPLRNRAALARARVVADEFDRVLKDYWTNKVFMFCDEPERKGSNYRARMFAPSAGVPEDPATGSANVAFAGYLGTRDQRRDGTLRWIVEQGFEMGRPSILEVEADKTNGVLTAARVGGDSVYVSKGEFFID